MPTLASIRAHKSEILALAEKCAIENIRIFGSVARGDATEASDVDFLVTSHPKIAPWGQIDFQIEAQALLGHPVDVMSDRAIHHLIRERILREAKPL
ncbi:MAG: nucleotidyltransferase domain-containing protein [Alphaproteobacteria bacterium]|nr:nucleotidyltransferase domain-containing protein [Alphaproteobacteria bacterium]